MKYIFYAYGHPNILGTHKTTLEFTKDKDLTLNGDCIVGINADFDLGKIKKLISLKSKKITITIKAINNKKLKETIKAQINASFDDSHELVIRKTDFLSERTLAIKANKAAFELNRELIYFLRCKDTKISVIIENKG